MRLSSPQPRNSSTPGLPPRPPMAIMAAGSSESRSSRWKTSVQKLFSSSGMFLRRRPQLGQKSSLVTNSLGLLARFFFLVPSSDLAMMTSFSSLSSLRASMTLTTFSWNSSASFLTSALPPPRRPAAPAAAAAAAESAATAAGAAGAGALAAAAAGSGAGMASAAASGAADAGSGSTFVAGRRRRRRRRRSVAGVAAAWRRLHRRRVRRGHRRAAAAASVRFIMACQASLYLYLSVGFSMYLIHRSSSS